VEDFKMAVSVHAVADYFIRKVDREAGDDMTHFKLQKLLYYAQAWYLAMHDEPMFPAQFEGWVHGPVCRDVYERFRHVARNPIPPEDATSDPVELDDNAHAFLDEVWDSYGQYTAPKLERMTHEEDPWLNARMGLAADEEGHNLLDEDCMRHYYRARMHARKRIRVIHPSQ
jgi:uncharacterized phage-associated protein